LEINSKRDKDKIIYLINNVGFFVSHRLPLAI